MATSTGRLAVWVGEGLDIGVEDSVGICSSGTAGGSALISSEEVCTVPPGQSWKSTLFLTGFSLNLDDADDGDVMPHCDGVPISALSLHVPSSAIGLPLHSESRLINIDPFCGSEDNDPERVVDLLVTPSFSYLTYLIKRGRKSTLRIKNADHITPPDTINIWAVGESVTVYCSAMAKMDTHASIVKVNPKESLSLNCRSRRSAAVSPIKLEDPPWGKSEHVAAAEVTEADPASRRF